MVDSWITITIQELLAKGEVELKTGPFGTQLHASDYVEHGTPAINARNLGFGDLRTDKLDYLSDETVKRLSSHLLQPGDIVFGRKGTVERHAFIKPEYRNWFQGTDCLRLRFKSPMVNSRFASYYFSTAGHKDWIINQSSHGATMTSLNQGIIGRISLRLPPPTLQAKIVAILTAYDDLLENNLRRIKILEEMARLIYSEWFVNFRFPGHERVKMVKSRLGDVPEGWDVRPIGQVIETLGGGTPSTENEEFWNGGRITWFSPSDLTANRAMFISDSSKKITQLGLQKSSARLFPPYCVMMTSRATIGVIAINTKEACTNQGFIICIPNQQLSAYDIYFWIQQNLETIDNIASGATYKEIGRAEFRELLIVLPDSKTSTRFNEIVQPIGKQVENLLARNTNLRRTRDLLLPKLISGEVDVEELDIRVAE